MSINVKRLVLRVALALVFLTGGTAVARADLGSSIFQDVCKQLNETSAGTSTSYVQSTHTSPVYPAIAQRNGQEGTVGLMLMIGPDGAVHDADIVRSSGYPQLDAAALVAIGNWRFVLTANNGKPGSVCRQVNIVFKFPDEPARAGSPRSVSPTVHVVEHEDSAKKPAFTMPPWLAVMTVLIAMSPALIFLGLIWLVGWLIRRSSRKYRIEYNARLDRQNAALDRIAAALEKREQP